MCKDFLGQVIDVGDIVVFMELRYRNLMLGKIKKITPKMLVIEHERNTTYSNESRQFPSQVMLYKKASTTDYPGPR